MKVLTVVELSFCREAKPLETPMSFWEASLNLNLELASKVPFPQYL